jgi:hypothetical protein
MATENTTRSIHDVLIDMNDQLYDVQSLLKPIVDEGGGNESGRLARIAIQIIEKIHHQFDAIELDVIALQRANKLTADASN